MNDKMSGSDTAQPYKIGSNTNRVIRYEDMLKDGVILEDVDKASVSVFRTEYYQASKTVLGIIERNRALCFFRDKRTGSGCSIVSEEDEPIYNIIPFIGKRGSGKSSAMRSFGKMLEHFSVDCNKYKDFAFSKEKVSFLALQYIDVSTLKSTEDVLAIILARMLQLLIREEKELRSKNEFHETEELRGLYQQFDEIYKNLLHLEGERSQSNGESHIKMLRDLSSSYSIAKDFRKLMRRYLRFFRCSGRCQRDDCYLVISLDDVDLYRYKDYKTSHGTEDRDAYTVLERVYEYLMIPGVVVLMTFNEDVLQNVCREHIRRKLDLQSDADELLRQFLEKIIPSFQKVYMPVFDRADNPAINRLLIQLPDASANNGDDSSYSVRSIFPKETQYVEVKQFTLRLIASVYGVYFDAMGLKPHFFEKKNLRELKDLFKILLDGITSKGAVGMNNFASDDWSYMRLTSYLNNQFAHEQLNPDEMRLFERWSKLPISRRSVDVLNYVRKLQQDNENARVKDNSSSLSPLVRNNLLSELPAEKHGYQYSYGELLCGLYRSTRMGQGLTKEMVYCLLTTYSATLNHRYQRYLAANCKSLIDCQKCKDYGIIKEVLGSSITGSRSNEILNTRFELKITEADTLLTKSHERRTYNNAGSVHFKNLERYFDEISLRLSYDPKGSTDDWEQDLHCIEMICMFFTDVQGGSPVSNGFQFLITPDGILSVKAKKYEEDLQACFNILNFVINSFSWREFFDSLHKDLCNAIMQLYYADASEDDKITTRKSVEIAIKKNSLQKDYEKAYNAKSGKKAIPVCPLPIQHFDMMYNIIKREADSRIPHGLPETASFEQYGALCWKVYDNMRNALKAQDEYYGGIPDRTKFVDIFDRCPFILEMKNIYSGETRGAPKTGNKLDKYMTNLGRIVATVSEYSRSIDETIRIFNR